MSCPVMSGILAVAASDERQQYRAEAIERRAEERYASMSCADLAVLIDEQAGEAGWDNLMMMVAVTAKSGIVLPELQRRVRELVMPALMKQAEQELFQ